MNPKSCEIYNCTSQHHPEQNEAGKRKAGEWVTCEQHLVANISLWSLEALSFILSLFLTLNASVRKWSIWGEKAALPAGATSELKIPKSSSWLFFHLVASGNKLHFKDKPIPTHDCTLGSLERGCDTKPFFCSVHYSTATPFLQWAGTCP